MQFTDEGYITGLRRHGENSAILTVVTKEHGKICGFVKSAFSKKKLAVLQLGNLIKIDAWSRVEENMLSLKIELISPYAVNFLSSADKLQVLSCFCNLCNICLPEQQSLDKFYNFVSNFINLSHEENWITNYCYFEFYLLSFLGVGLDLSKCVVTSSTKNLTYVSPKSAMAVSLEAGLAYKDKLFKFPKFIVENNYYPSIEEVLDLLKMTGFFLNKNFFQIHNLQFPLVRANLCENITKH